MNQYLRKWIDETYPLMGNDIEELDHYDLEKFANWMEKQFAISGAMPRSLTAENGAKALLMGEFFEEHESSHYDAGGELVEYTEKVPVRWDTIKEIYAKIVAH